MAHGQTVKDIVVDLGARRAGTDAVVPVLFLVSLGYRISNVTLSVLVDRRP